MCFEIRYDEGNRNYFQQQSFSFSHAWEIEKCTSILTYTPSEPKHKHNIRRCCLKPGQYTLTCRNRKDAKGWGESSIMINGQKNCDNFVGYRTMQVVDLIGITLQLEKDYCSPKNRYPGLPRDFMLSCVIGRYRSPSSSINNATSNSQTDDKGNDHLILLIHCYKLVIESSFNYNLSFRYSLELIISDKKHNPRMLAPYTSYGIQCPEGTTFLQLGNILTCFCEDLCSWRKCKLHPPPANCLSGISVPSEWVWKPNLLFWMAEVKGIHI